MVEVEQADDYKAARDYNTDLLSVGSTISIIIQNKYIYSKIKLFFNPLI